MKYPIDCKSILENKKILFTVSFLILGYYLWPLFHSPLYVESFDNLDSNVVWFKILSQSHKAFAPNMSIVPQMMNGLPRVSYGSEWSILYWMYHFLPAETAWRINAFLIHIIAFMSMYIFSNRYLQTKNSFHTFKVFIISLLYSMLPFWPNAGLSTSLLPLYTYILLNVLHHDEKWYEWGLLLLMPLYSSFVFLYMFYIGFAILFWAYMSVKHNKIENRLLFAILLMTTAFLLTQYRLVEMELFGRGFVSHRSEFEIYFNLNFHDAYVYALKFFLDGWMEHQRTLMMPVLLPAILISILLSLVNRKLGSLESLVVYILIILSYYVDLWHILIINKYFLPALFFGMIYLSYHNPKYRIFYMLILILILLAVWNGLCFYNGLSFLKEHFQIFKMLNFSRASFVSPFLWYIALYYAFSIYLEKLRFAPLLILSLLIYQIYYSVMVRRFDNYHKYQTVTFESYYAPGLFSKIKKTIGKPVSSYRVVSYGIEPAVALYNGLYTVDGYSTNYPLSYKKKFYNVQRQCFERMPGNKKQYSRWGSKVYLLCVDSRPENYHIYRDRNITSLPFNANTDALCSLGTNYIISAHKLKDINKSKVHFLGHYDSNQTMWDLYLYRLKCRGNSS